MRYLCRVLNMALAFDDESGEYSILDGCAPQDGGGYTYASKAGYENPMEAISGFFGQAEMRMRRKIGDRLEAEDRDRYTGELVKRGQ